MEAENWLGQQWSSTAPSLRLAGRPRKPSGGAPWGVEPLCLGKSSVQIGPAGPAASKQLPTGSRHKQHPQDQTADPSAEEGLGLPLCLRRGGGSRTAVVSAWACDGRHEDGSPLGGRAWSRLCQDLDRERAIGVRVGVAPVKTAWLPQGESETGKERERRWKG